MDAVMKILSGTPWYVWVLLVYLTYVSYKFSKPRTVNLKRPFLLPIILIVLGAVSAIRSGFIFSSVVHTEIIAKWFLVLLSSVLIGFADGRKTVIQKKSNQYQLISSGGWLTPFILFAIFFMKYYIEYSLASSPTDQLHIANLLASEFIAGYLLGRVFSLGLKYLRSFRNA